ncbi:MAG TPA: carbon storage regulator [Pirellulales bacterium]
MLVLSRKEGQRIVIGGSIVITIMDSRSNRVRIGVEAPTEVPIHREEIFQRIGVERRAPILSASPNESAFHPEFA